MNELIWINGEIINLSDARISVEDRGYQFADGVYEVIRFYNGKPFTLREHLVRLENSAKGIELSVPMSVEALSIEVTRFITRCGIKEGMIYLQLTRGVSLRNHIFPGATCKPTLLFYARGLAPVSLPGEGEGAKLMAVADERWKRCWIKSIALLPNVLAKNAAVREGYDEAVFIEHGIATECSASNLFGVIGRKLVTHPVGSKVLPGITRQVLFALAPKLGIEIDERPLREEEAMRAEELFITSTTRELSWVARWNDRYIGQGKCGEITRRLHTAYQDEVRRQCYTA